jgi:hypothetical protein
MSTSTSMQYLKSAQRVALKNSPFLHIGKYSDTNGLLQNPLHKSNHHLDIIKFTKDALTIQDSHLSTKLHHVHKHPDVQLVHTS